MLSIFVIKCWFSEDNNISGRNAFFFHKKHHTYTLKSLNEIISLVSRSNEILFIIIETIHSAGDLPGSLNKPESSVSPVDSIRILS